MCVRMALSASIRFRSAGRIAALVLLGCAGGGCSELLEAPAPGSEARGWQLQRLPNAPVDAAFDAGVYALRQHFPAVNPSRGEGRIESGWLEFEQRGGTGRLRDETLNFRNRMRHRAIVMVAPEAAGSVARCRVEVERLDTSDHLVFAHQGRFEDLPNQTPIEREASTTSAQNQVWTPVNRDGQLELTLLRILFEKATGPATAPSERG